MAKKPQSARRIPAPCVSYAFADCDFSNVESQVDSNLVMTSRMPINFAQQNTHGVRNGRM